MSDVVSSSNKPRMPTDQRTPSIKMPSSAANQDRRRSRQVSEEVLSRDLSRIYKEIYMADDAPIP